MTRRVLFFIYVVFFLWVLFFFDPVSSFENPAHRLALSSGSVIIIGAMLYLDDTNGWNHFPIGSTLLGLMGCMFILKAYFAGQW